MRSSKVKTLLVLIMIVTCVTIGLSGTAVAQDQDTLVVEPGFSTLNDAIVGDTLADGSQKNLNRVYKLKRGQRYVLNGRIKSGNYHLRIVGEADDPFNSLPPATLWPAVRQDGGFDNIMLDANGDLTIKNVYFLGMVQTGNVVNDGIRLLSDSTRMIVDNCIFEHIGTHCMRMMAPGQKAYITNSKFRNLINLTGGIFRGRIINCNHQWQDSVVVLNNTIMNHQAMAFQGRKNPVNYFRWEHNTHINTMKNAFHFEWWLNAYLKNNLFINPHVAGEALSERKGQDPDGLLMGSIMWIDTLDVNFGISENERIIHFSNNNWYRDPAFDNYINSIDSVEVEPFLNERTVAFFANYEKMVEENNLNIDPQFANPPNTKQAMIDYLKDYRSGVSPAERTSFDYNPDGDPFTLDWPLPEDLSYPTSSTLYTAGDDGLPLGDLNWFPDKKAEWEAWITEVPKSKQRETRMTEDFELAQNYPNPFNPETEISYSLKKSGRISLIIYNMVGQKVKTLVDQEVPAGLHIAHWNGLDDNGSQMASGIYYYRLETDSFKATKKMLLMK